MIAINSCLWYAVYVCKSKASQFLFYFSASKFKVCTERKRLWFSVWKMCVCVCVLWWRVYCSKAPCIPCLIDKSTITTFIRCMNMCVMNYDYYGCVHNFLLFSGEMKFFDGKQSHWTYRIDTLLHRTYHTHAYAWVLIRKKTETTSKLKIWNDLFWIKRKHNNWTMNTIYIRNIRDHVKVINLKCPHKVWKRIVSVRSFWGDTNSMRIKIQDRCEEARNMSSTLRNNTENHQLVW